MSSGVSSGTGGPVADVSRGWFPADAAEHLRDAPRFCPGCASPLLVGSGGHGIVVEFWQGGDRVFACYCGSCGWSGDIYLTGRVLGHEPDEQ